MGPDVLFEQLHEVRRPVDVQRFNLLPSSLLLTSISKKDSQKAKQIELFLIETAAYRREAPIGGW
jgi:hypothetical protein